MISLKFKVNINNSRINGRISEFKKVLYPAVKTQIYKGAEPYTPYLSGDLMDSADASARDSTRYLIYDEPYAKYQFYAGGGAPDDDFNRSTGTHPLAHCLWTECYLNAGGRNDIQRLCDTAPQLLRF